MNLWKSLFRSSKKTSRDPQRRDPAESETGYVGHDAHVIWADGDIQRFSVAPSSLNSKLLDNTKTLLFALSCDGSVTQGSVATGRVQRLTRLNFAAGSTNVQGVRISSGDARSLLVVLMLAGCVDAAQTKIALRTGLEEQKVSVEGIKSVLGSFPHMPAMVIVAFGPKTDPAINEALGLALYLGAAAKDQTTSSAVPPPPPDRSGSDLLPIDQVTLEQLALLNQRSAFILTGMAQGSRSQADAWDRWLESYRLPSFQDAMPLLHQAGADHIVSVQLIVATAMWGECQGMPIRFVATFGSASAYAIPRDADPVPDITDYQRPAAEDGSRLASIEGQVERL